MHVLFAWVPLGVLQKLVGVVTGFPDDAARTTAAFIQSRGGVRQALYLARDEMQTIKADRWDDELWGVSKADASTTADKTKLFFYFGTNDHWVANETRDELMAARAPVGSQTGKDGPVMEIDDTGLPHGFCISEFSRCIQRRYVADSPGRTQRGCCPQGARICGQGGNGELVTISMRVPPVM